MVHDRTMRIAHLGTFDVENYGDLLFPVIARRRLSQYFPQLVVDFVSPAGGPSVWSDTVASLSYDDFSAKMDSYDGFLIGGGNIIRLNPTDLEAYKNGLTPLLGYSNLWAGISEENDFRRPICWNAPGVPATFPSMLKTPLTSCLNLTDYLSVRDEPSHQILKELVPGRDVTIVPDTAWDIDELWTKGELDTEYKKTFSERSTPERSIAVHANSRYVSGLTPETLANHLDRISERLNATVILIAIGPCHGDDNFANVIGKFMQSHPLIIDQPASLLQVAACISRSMGYVGSSMHGFITASAFKKPAVIVAAKSMNKFTGLLESIEGPQLLHQSWINALEHFSDIILSGQQQFLSNSSKTALDKHWSTIADLFSKEASTRSFPDGRNEKKLRPSAKPRSVRFKESILELRAKELLGQQRKASQKIAELQAGHDEDFQKMEHLIADQKRQLEELQILRNNEIINSSKQISELKTLIVNTESSMRATQQAYAAEQSKSTMRIRHLETELHIKRQKIDDMLASTSWRITAPIRKVKSLWNKPPSK
ncbi:polysaccharide pyruvyl transferase family protein [Phyllobacterium sp. K27]